MKTSTKTSKPSAYPLHRIRTLSCATLLALTSLHSAMTIAAPQALSASAEVSLGTDELSCENTDDDIQDVIEQMADLGYGVATASFKPVKFDLGPYASGDIATIKDFEIPFAERNSFYMVLEYDADVPGSPGFTKYSGIQSPQDAIVFRGCTPPEMKNTRFSFQSFLQARATGVDEYVEVTGTPPIRASLTDPLWLEDLKVDPDPTSLYPAPYDRKTNIVFSADQQTIDDLKTAFANAGLLNTSAFNAVALPTDKFSFGEIPGTGKPLLNGLRIFMKWDRLEDYHPDAFKLYPTDYVSRVYTEQSFPVYIFYRDVYEARVKIPENLRKTSPPREQMDLARSYKTPFETLVKAVIFHYMSQGLRFVSAVAFREHGANVEGQPVFNAEHGGYCLENLLDCQYDSYADAYWWDQQSHQLGDDDVYVVVGIDHAKLGMADGGSYLGIYDLQDENGWLAEELTSWTPSELSWSKVSDALVLMHPYFYSVAEKSFLVELTRPHNCRQDKPSYAFRCADTTQIAENDSFIFRGRTSFNPATGTRPSHSQLIPWRLLHFKK